MRAIRPFTEMSISDILRQNWNSKMFNNFGIPIFSNKLQNISTRDQTGIKFV